MKRLDYFTTITPWVCPNCKVSISQDCDKCFKCGKQRECVQ